MQAVLIDTDGKRKLWDVPTSLRATLTDLVKFPHHLGPPTDIRVEHKEGKYICTVLKRERSES